MALSYGDYQWLYSHFTYLEQKALAAQAALGQLATKLDALTTKVDVLSTKTDTLLTKEAAMAATLDDVVAKVTAQKTVIDSAVTLLGELKAKLDAAILSGDMTKVQAIADALDTQDADLAAAVAANTPTP